MQHSNAPGVVSEFQPLLGWLRENIHRHGRKYLPNELILRATGEPLSAHYYVEYLREKFSNFSP